MAYAVEGSLLEVCDCNVMCPCWVGEDPDYGICQGLLVWNIKKGNVDATDISGHTLAALCHIPGNILKGDWSVRLYVDQQASAAQKDAILNVWSGKLGGPIADMAKLIGKIESVEQVPISFDIVGSGGSVKIGASIEAALEGFKGATGSMTALHDTIFTTVPGSPAYPAKASYYRASVPGFSIDLKGRNAVSGSFRFTG